MAQPGAVMRSNVYWDAAQKKWTGLDVHDFPATKAPSTAAKKDGVVFDTYFFAFPFIMKAVFFFSSRRRHTRWNCEWSSDVCSSDLGFNRIQNQGSRRGRFLLKPPDNGGCLG